MTIDEFNPLVAIAIDNLSVSIYAQQQVLQESTQLEDQIFKQWDTDRHKTTRDVLFKHWKEADQVSNLALEVLLHLHHIKDFLLFEDKERLLILWNLHTQKKSDLRSPQQFNPSSLRQQQLKLLLHWASTTVKSSDSPVFKTS